MAAEPSMDAWLAEAKQAPNADLCGMYLTHNGIVRATAKAQVREGVADLPPVKRVDFSYDAEGVRQAETDALAMPGIYYVRTWLAEGPRNVGDTIMYVLIGGDIRPHVVDCLQALVGKIKNDLVVETEVFDES